MPKALTDEAVKKETSPVGFADTLSLWLGHSAALTVHRTVIHYRLNPKGMADRERLNLKENNK